MSVPLPGGDAPHPVALIEYKVDAAEGEEQTADYAKWAATQRFKLGDREVLPQQVYLCPVASDDVTPAAPFVTIGYDAYLRWADGVDRLEMTAQAKFLLDEWRACLLARNDVVDEGQETLIARLKKDGGDAIRMLRIAPPGDLADLQHALDQHAEVFTQLGVRHNRQSKGHSAAVTLARGALEAALTDDQWNVTGGGGSLRAVFLPFVNQVAAWAKAPVRLSGLRIQLFSERPARGRFRLVLEVIRDLPGTNSEVSRAVRLKIAEAVRGALKQADPTLPAAPERHPAHVRGGDAERDRPGFRHRRKRRRATRRAGGDRCADRDARERAEWMV